MSESKESVIASDQNKAASQTDEPATFYPEGVAELDLYQKREKIYTRSIKGFYQRLRVYTGWPLLIGYFLLPWLNLEGHQAVLFDLPARKFHIFWLTFWPQDFPMLAIMLIVAAFSLFAITTWAGRVWCGYTCPQTVWTAIFMWAEQLTEGSRNQRIKRDRGPWTFDKIHRKTLKHIMWIGFAFLTGFTFVGYFSPIRQMTMGLLHVDLSFWEIAWINFFTCATYINAGWMREQVCKYVCPYARFQSVMFDSDTLIVSYDKQRGEPRGARKRGEKSAQLGDCVDCSICVQVCPVGIDIRNGLQYLCINCALCIDACNSVMKQMAYPTGLISYTTENQLLGKPHRMIRPRLVGYSTAVVVFFSVFVSLLIIRTPLELDVIRDRDRLYREVDNGIIENTYTLKIINMDRNAHRYRVSVDGLPGVKIKGEHVVSIQPGEVNELPITLMIEKGKLQRQITNIRYQVEALDDSKLIAESDSRFFGPGVSKDENPQQTQRSSDRYDYGKSDERIAATEIYVKAIKVQ